MDVIQHIVNGFKQPHTFSHAILVAKDINKALNNVTRHIFTIKILDTTPHKKKKVVSEWAVRPMSLMMVSHVYSMMNFPNEQVFNLLQFLYICPCTGHTMKVLWWGDNPKICHNTQTQIRQQQTCKIMLQLEHWLIQTVMTVSQQKITLMWLYPSRKSPLLSSSWKVKNPIYTLL